MRFLMVCALAFAALTAQAQPQKDWQDKGERLTYDVRFWGMRAGSAEILYRPLEDDAYRVVARAWSNGLSSFVYIRDRVLVEGVNTDAAIPFATEKYSVRLNENDYQAKKDVLYNRRTSQITYDNLKDNAPGLLYGLHPRDIRDVFSALYFLRSQVKNPKVGDVYTHPVWDLDKGYNLQLKVLEKKTVKSLWGKKEVFHMQPVLQPLDGTSRAKDKWHMYVTADEAFIPVEISVDLPLGSFAARLEGYGDAQSASDVPDELIEVGALQVRPEDRHFHAVQKPLEN